jgi:hypothetical protein
MPWEHAGPAGLGRLPSSHCGSRPSSRLMGVVNKVVWIGLGKTMLGMLTEQSIGLSLAHLHGS